MQDHHNLKHIISCQLLIQHIKPLDILQVEDLNNECFAEELDPSIKKKNWLKQQAAEEAARAGQDRTQPIPVSLDWYEIQEYERAFKVSHIQEYERAFKVSHIQEYERAFKVSHIQEYERAFKVSHIHCHIRCHLHANKVTHIRCHKMTQLCCHIL